jgi:hypothetical protein
MQTISNTQALFEFLASGLHRRTNTARSSDAVAAATMKSEGGWRTVVKEYFITHIENKIVVSESEMSSLIHPAS